MYLRLKNKQGDGISQAKIRCFIGGEWKPRSEFSNSQLEKFQRSGANPAKAKISCRVHSPQVRRELRCQGPCGMWLPLESFSKNTRNHGKIWCLDCTEWQLSVEPGFTPHVPPTGVDGDDDNQLEDGHTVARAPEHQAGERVEEWIQGNPSELGDYDGIETGTQLSILDTASEVTGTVSGQLSRSFSGPSLLDSSSHELGGLPQALNAVNLSRIGYDHPKPPSYASVASVGAAGFSSHPCPRSGSGTSMAGTPGRHQASAQAHRPGQDAQYSLMDELSETQSLHSSTALTITSKAQTITTNTNTTANVVAVTNTTNSAAAKPVWMERGQMQIAAVQVQPNPPTRNGWARPIQRKTEILTPKYVASGNVPDAQTQSLRKTMYADADDDDSEDEC